MTKQNNTRYKYKKVGVEEFPTTYEITVLIRSKKPLDELIRKLKYPILKVKTHLPPEPLEVFEMDEK